MSYLFCCLIPHDHPSVIFSMNLTNILILLVQCLGFFYPSTDTHFQSLSSSVCTSEFILYTPTSRSLLSCQPIKKYAGSILTIVYVLFTAHLLSMSLIKHIGYLSAVLASDSGSAQTRSPRTRTTPSSRLTTATSPAATTATARP